MSGGHYDYGYAVVSHLGADIATDGELRPHDPGVGEAMQYCGNALRALAELAHAIEWYMSGDSGPERVLKMAEATKAAIRGLDAA